MSLATVAARPASWRWLAADRWIISPRGDLLLIVAAPLLILVTFWTAQHVGWSQALALAVMSMLATGHHLPGFLRMYGDPELFARYRLRFVLIPIVVFGVALWCSFYNLKAMLFIVLIWAVWHSLMQLYGFGRIYDAKNGEVSPLTARLDRLFCLTWFATLALTAPFSAKVQSLAETIGIEAITDVVFAPQTVFVAWVVTWGLTALYVAYTAWLLAQGRGVSPIKLAMLGTSLVLLWGSWRVVIANPFVSLAMWESYHDIQYFAIVWGFAQKRNLRPGLNRFASFLFRPRLWLVVLYVGLIAAYGGFFNLSKASSSHVVVHTFYALLTVSTIMHFYSDGFIWKIRRPSIREELDIPDVAYPQAQAASPARSQAPAPRMRAARRARQGHWISWRDCAAQTGLLGLPVLLLAAAQIEKPSWELPLYRAVARWMPSSTASQIKLAGLYAKSDQWSQAAEECRQVLTAQPSDADARFILAQALERQDDPAGAVREYGEVLRIKPDVAEAHLRLGMLLFQQARYDAAAKCFSRALECQPDYFEAHNNLGATCLRLGDLQGAARHYDAALHIKPNEPVAQQNLNEIRKRQRG